MPLFDLPLEQLRGYRFDAREPADFDAFWSASLRETARHPLVARFDRVESTPLALVDAYDVSFAGWSGQTIRGWLLAPTGATQPHPCIVSFVGYGGGRSLPLDHLAWPCAGFVQLVMDTRGQGSGWSVGDTPDNADSGPQTPGFMTRGITSRESYYYRRVYCDAVRAVQAAAGHPLVDAGRIGVAGMSQGGGIAIAAAALAPQFVKLLVADVPFLCAMRRAIEIVDTAPYNEIARYLQCHRDQTAQVLETLAYFDAVNFAPRVQARTLFSVGLFDTTCPPSTVFAAYNAIPAKKDIRVYAYNAHEGGDVFQLQDALQFAKTWL